MNPSVILVSAEAVSPILFGHPGALANALGSQYKDWWLAEGSFLPLPMTGQETGRGGGGIFLHGSLMFS